jgi:hypothetical protein
MLSVLLLTSCNIRIFLLLICLRVWVRGFFEPHLMKGTLVETSWVLVAETVYKRRQEKRQLT